VPHLRLPRLRRDGPSRALRAEPPNARLGVRRVLAKGRPSPALLNGCGQTLAFSATFAAQKRNAPARGSSVRPHARSVTPRCPRPAAIGAGGSGRARPVGRSSKAVEAGAGPIAGLLPSQLAQEREWSNRGSRENLIRPFLPVIRRAQMWRISWGLGHHRCHPVPSYHLSY
jgi:hypothetical protein